jgi:hypothetical protein
MGGMVIAFKALERLCKDLEENTTDRETKLMLIGKSIGIRDCISELNAVISELELEEY